MFTALWAQDRNGLIGKDEKMPWYLPNDLKFFKEKTLDSNIVMGRKTYEGLGKKTLPNRKNIVLTTNKDYDSENEDVLVLHSIDEVLDYAKSSNLKTNIIGGASIYKGFQPYINEVYVTKIDHEFDGDTYFPKWDFENYQLVNCKEGLVDEKNKYKHTFYHYIKK
jgi:dihydrofolate reductase/thymidylate synthase